MLLERAYERVASLARYSPAGLWNGQLDHDDIDRKFQFEVNFCDVLNVY